MINIGLLSWNFSGTANTDLVIFAEPDDTVHAKADELSILTMN